MNKQTSYHWIPGFLGKASDWESIVLKAGSKAGSKGWIPEAQHFYYDLFSPALEKEVREKERPFTLRQWGDWINAQAILSPSPRVLIGYSLGGRVALHSILSELFSNSKQGVWEGAVIISAHPGISDPFQRQERLESDRKWANRFRQGPWEQVIQEWNQQSVFFGGNAGQERREVDYCTQTLTDVLTSCSLGVQRDLRPLLSSVQIPVLWISGEKDVKYHELYSNLVNLNPLFTWVSIPEAGHRVPWDQSVIFQKVLTEYWSNGR